jgi:hypothetical protein
VSVRRGDGILCALRWMKWSHPQPRLSHIPTSPLCRHRTTPPRSVVHPRTIAAPPPKHAAIPNRRIARRGYPSTVFVAMVRRPPAPFDAVDSHHRLATPSSIASQVSTSSSITNDAIPNHHYGRGNLSRVPRSSPSAKNRALVEDNLLEEELHSGKTGTRKRKVAFDGNNRRSRLKKT